MRNLHAWDLDPDEAVKVQAALRERLVLKWDGRDVNMIGGVDVSLKEDKAHAVIVLLRCPDLKPVKGVAADAPLIFPYIPGLLAEGLGDARERLVIRAYFRGWHGVTLTSC